MSPGPHLLLQTAEGHARMASALLPLSKSGVSVSDWWSLGHILGASYRSLGNVFSFPTSQLEREWNGG